MKCFIFNDDMYNEIDEGKAELVKCRTKNEVYELPSFVLTPLNKSLIVSSICTKAFSTAYSTKEITFPESTQVVEFKEDIFIFSGISIITIPKSLKHMGSQTPCKEVKIDKRNNFFSQEENQLSYSNFPLTLFFAPKNIKRLILRESLTSIERQTFWGYSITHIHIPSSLQSIGAQAFSLCKSLKVVTFAKNSQLKVIHCDAFSNSRVTNIHFPSNLLEIGERAFQNCVSLKIIKFDRDSKLAIIHRESFDGASQLTSVHFPSSVRLIKDRAFAATKIKKVVFDEDSKLEFISNFAYEYVGS